MGDFKRRRGGFKAFEQEEQRKEQERSLGRNSIFGMFLKEGESDIPIRFLTSEPILGHFHAVPKQGGRGFDDVPCTGAGCEHCADGDRASFAGAWLVVDERPWDKKIRENGKETGEVEEVPFSVRILKRGTKDIAVYDKKNSKYNLVDYSWEMSRVGKESATTYSIERLENDPLTVEEKLEYLENLPKGLLNYVEERIEEEGGADEISEEDFEEIMMDLVEFSLYKDTEGVVESLEAFEAEYEARRQKEEPKTRKFGGKSSKNTATSTGKKTFRSKARASGIVEDDEEEEEAPARKRKLPSKSKAPTKKKVIKGRR